MNPNGPTREARERGLYTLNSRRRADAIVHRMVTAKPLRPNDKQRIVDAALSLPVVGEGDV
jgi:hypothetical protein